MRKLNFFLKMSSFFQNQIETIVTLRCLALYPKPVYPKIGQHRSSTRLYYSSIAKYRLGSNGFDSRKLRSTDFYFCLS